MYKLTDKEFEIHSVITPKTLKELSELGLYDSKLEPEKEVDIIFDLFTEEDKFKKLTHLIFNVDELEWDKVNLIEWMRGYKDFFTQLVKSFSS